ncbi:prepilin-type N-terminal cleavage/methylation domain-containing protein [Paenisporosarcina indica]|uniref:prepilin-type N-terminal cleavage/methylation domain-containing protein n=1 Tax=Paenisporosarcina indica TaxID=650093 RepID=UPI00094F8BEE|nr:prepilin-type N-terminal cleavage/methylation domain-containing protein [Paenisporosarcina indica]
MRKFIQNKLKEQKGLTLIELLAVIVILAIIAAIAIPAIGNIIENSRVGAIKSDAQNALAAANIYYTDNPDAPSGVTVATLKTSNYMQDIGSLSVDSTSIAKVPGGNTISGSGAAGGITVTFTTATNANIAAYKNSQRGAGTGASLGVNASTTP